MDKLCAVDYETLYDQSYSLTTLSVHAYTHDPRFCAYMVAITDGVDIRYVGPPQGFDWSLLRGYTLCAHNASFDMAVTLRLIEIGVIKDASIANAQWICSADMSAFLGVKRDLKSAVKYLLGREISKAVRAGTKGRTADDLANDPEVLKYAGDDADLCLELIKTHIDKWPVEEREISRLNREAAMYGLRVDQAQVAEAIASLEPKVTAALDKIPWVKRGEKPLSPNSFKDECERAGIPFPAGSGECNDYGGTRPCMAKTDPVFLKWLADYGPKYPWAAALGEYRSLNTFLKRITVLRDGYDKARDRFPYQKKYFGCTTGRFSGGGDSGGKFNVENMPRQAMFGVDIRPMVLAAPGHVLVVADYNQIEPRYLFWRVGDTAALKPCFEGKNIYQAYAEAHGICQPGQKLKEMGALYNMVKARVILLGYQSGGPKFRSAAEAYKVFISEDESAAEVSNYRKDNWRIVNYWGEHQRALAFSARRKDNTHQVELPSGRILTYFNPEYRGREISVYQARGENRTFIYGGMLTENETQAACRDILCDAWRAVNAAGIRVVLTVHDELVAEVPEDNADWTVKTMRELMCNSSPWAKGLPLSIDASVSKFYTK